MKKDLSLSNVLVGKILILCYQFNLKLLLFCFFVLVGIVYMFSLDNINYDFFFSLLFFLMYIMVIDGKWYDMDYLFVQVQNVNEYFVFFQIYYLSLWIEGVVCV